MVDIVRGWADVQIMSSTPHPPGSRTAKHMSTTIVWYINSDIGYYIQASCTIAVVAIPREAAIQMTPSTKPRGLNALLSTMFALFRSVFC